jgi:hypothetical protein
VFGSDYIKVTSIHMLHNGNSAQNVSDSLGIDISTVYRYAGLSRQGGVSTMTGNKYQGYWGMLSSVQISLLRSNISFMFILTPSLLPCG